jgi:hypothetical protein
MRQDVLRPQTPIRDLRQSATKREAENHQLIVYVTHRETMERWRFARSGAHGPCDARELEETFLNGDFQRELISIEEQRVAPNVRGLIARAVRRGDGFAGLDQR